MNEKEILHAFMELENRIANLEWEVLCLKAQITSPSIDRNITCNVKDKDD